MTTIICEQGVRTRHEASCRICGAMHYQNWIWVEAITEDERRNRVEVESIIGRDTYYAPSA